MNLQTHINPELWSAISNTYEAGNYSPAIQDAIHFMTDVLREKVDSDADGVKLVGQALGGDSPQLRLNKMQTETEKNIQRGFEDILRGTFRAIRNPRSHEQNEDDKETADAVIYFIDYLLKILGQSEKRFTIDGFLERVFDPDFVESERYAGLLVDEIPQGKIYDALVELYREKLRGDGRKLCFVFCALLEKISDAQKSDFWSVVSEELKTTSDDRCIRIVFQILPTTLWTRINEVARIRIEGKINRYIRDAEAYYSHDSGQVVCNGNSALATWTRDFLPYFVLKSEVAATFLQKLEDSDPDDRRYMAEYFMFVLPEVVTLSYRIDKCVQLISSAIRNGDQDIRKSIIRSIHSYPEEWQLRLTKALEDVTDRDNAAVYLPNGTPFLSLLDEEFGPPPGDVDDIPF